MTDQSDLNTPWSLHFDRDGTEDYGIICDSDGNDLVASHITGSKTPQRWKDRWEKQGFGAGCFWLPENEGDETPYLVRVMQLMTAAPKLLELLKVAMATADWSKHKWVKEAQEAISEAMAQPYDRQQVTATRRLHEAAPKLLQVIRNTLEDENCTLDYERQVLLWAAITEATGEEPKLAD